MITIVYLALGLSCTSPFSFEYTGVAHEAFCMEDVVFGAALYDFELKVMYLYPAPTPIPSPIIFADGFEAVSG